MTRAMSVMATRSLFSTAVGLALLLHGPAAQADWREIGVAVHCAKDGSRFELAATAEASTPDQAIAVPPGFRPLAHGKHKLRCRVGKEQVRAVVQVFPPSGVGPYGTGYVSVDRLTVGSRVVLEHPTAFNYSHLEPVELSSVKVRRRGKVTEVEFCHRNVEQNTTKCASRAYP